MQVILYKKANNGKTQQWQIEVIEEEGVFRTLEGYVDGKITPTEWTHCEGKRKGASNETTPGQQAVKEAQAKVVKQKKKGWTEDVNNIEEAARKHLPMLAKIFQDEFDKLYSTGCILAAQPKLDGVRDIDTVEGPFSKEGNVHNPAGWVLHEHSMNILAGIEHVKLDGELYNHEYKANFNAIASIVRTQKPSEEQLQLAKDKLQYHLYDINVPNMSFAARHASLTLLLQDNPHPSFKLVETVFINTKGRSKEDVEKQLFELHTRWVKEGYEGSMIRNADAFYQQKRTRDLLKRKDWIDEEFELVDILPGKGNKAGMAASVICRDTRGEEFSAGVIGNEDYCVCILAMKKDYIGQMATIKYQNLTPDRKVPRFGKMKAIRDYE